ncbi:MAG: circularly permuted type 2 ATP-grasp protein, partial [Saprospiraceae bacterium]|nr:circularly permuted type 2 ATP-grasp protein [Saprospiraceae bacterium]
NGDVWAHWRKILGSYDNMGLDTLQKKQREVQRQLRENGVTYNIYGDPEGINRPWDLDPIPMIFSSEDWDRTERGLIQRVNLLNQILLDIYGSRSLLRSNGLPLEMIYNHQGFLRQADKIRLPGSQQLIHYSADLARGPNGQMWVLNDRTDAPSGTGYALENRAAMTRVFPDLIRDNRVRKIFSYYQTLRESLALLSPGEKEDPRIVILSPGPTNETYFEHAYLSSFLGFVMAFGQDLTVRDGYVWLRTLKGLEKVDVIIRRVDDVYCDPLEFRADSQLGVVGLMEAVRQKNVTIVNPLGCRILENPGLMAFLPSLCREIMGEDLILPSVATWWCGQEQEKNYVLDNIRHLIIKNIYRSHKNHSIFGGSLTSAQVDELGAKIRERPYLYVGQETVSFSTTPSLVDGVLQPKNALLRSFVAADIAAKSYSVMPGGLSRTSVSRGFFNVSNQTGGISKDAWVLGPSTIKALTEPKVRNRVVQPVQNLLPSRAGESLYWLGRYLERVVYTVRMLRIVLRKFNESDVAAGEEQDQVLTVLLRSLTHLTITYPGFAGVKKDKKHSEALLRNPTPELTSLALDADRVGSLAHSLQGMLNNSYAVRDRLSLDTWRILDGISNDWERLKNMEGDLTTIHNALDQLIVGLMAFNGLNLDSMTRESSWRLLNIGRSVESAVCSATLMRSTLVYPKQGDVDKVLMEVILLCNDSLLTYRYRYRSNLVLSGVLKLLLNVPESPRSLIYLLTQLETLIKELPKNDQLPVLPKIDKKILEAKMIVLLSEINELTAVDKRKAYRDKLEDLLSRLYQLMTETSDLIVENYFSHTIGQYGLIKASRLPDI